MMIMMMMPCAAYQWSRYLYAPIHDADGLRPGNDTVREQEIENLRSTLRARPASSERLEDKVAPVVAVAEMCTVDAANDAADEAPSCSTGNRRCSA